MKNRNLLVVLLALSIVSLFQNCGKVDFENSTGSLTKVTTDPDNNAEGMPIVTDEDGEDTGEEDSPVAQCEGKKCKCPDKDEDDTDDDVDNANYICILEGPGKSVRLGYSGGGLVEVGSTPSVVCMTKSACLNIVSQKFEVKGPEKRGFCPNKNPHVISMSDAELSDAL